jgi:hypothetical protein
MSSRRDFLKGILGATVGGALIALQDRPKPKPKKVDAVKLQKALNEVFPPYVVMGGGGGGAAGQVLMLQSGSLNYVNPPPGGYPRYVSPYDDDEYDS